MSRVVDYISGVCRNEPDKNKTHLYAKTAAGRLWPMCGYGWNRSNGHRLSILRGWTSPRGPCSICERRVNADLRPWHKSFPHKTRWL